MKKRISIILVVLLASAGTIFMISSCDRVKENKKKPNVILVLTDDQGYGDLSVHGNPVLKTPVLDELYNECIRFTDFHSAPMCSPTRGQLMTGMDALCNGCTAVCLGRSMVREELPIMAGIFKASGYRTAHFGKWHMGDSYPYRPQDRGFDETVSHGAWGIGSIPDYYQNTYWDAVFRHNEELQKYDGYCTDVWFNLALDYISSWKEVDKPFFVYLATNCPHGPHLCDDKYSDPYLDKGMTPVVSKFFGQIANIDENMERLLTTLDEKGLAGNTILIYMTDNGTVRGHEVFNAGMRGHKTQPWEGGHRVPLFIRWPEGKLGEPRDIDILAQCQDLLPTLIDWCGLKKPDNAAFNGSSLAPVFSGNTEDLEDRILVVEYDNPYRPEENRVVMWKKWRLVMDKELYDLSTDPGQTTDVAEKYPDVMNSMQEYYRSWKERALTGYNQTRYIHLGTEKQNPLTLYSSDWQGSYADNSGDLFAGDRIGYWNVLVETPGTYEFTLYRWHPASGIPLAGAMEYMNGIERGARPVAQARLKIEDFDKVVSTGSDQTEVKFTVELQEGIHKIETWLMDENGEPLCSAYYTVTELLN
jgi:arylsulfatase A-like enzyme